MTALFTVKPYIDSADQYTQPTIYNRTSNSDGACLLVKTDKDKFAIKFHSSMDHDSFLLMRLILRENKAKMLDPATTIEEIEALINFYIC